MKKYISLLLVLTFFLTVPAHAAPNSGAIPTFSITTVVTDSTVTIMTYNFPANDTFDVLMGNMGTRGVSGIKVDTISSGTGGTFTATFMIPDALKGKYQIAVRLQSKTGSGYYAYNWFYNNTASGPVVPPGTPFTGIPTFRIKSVEKDISVTIETKHFPKNDTFDVLMNHMGTRGKNGILVDFVSSGAGGTLTFTFNIPAALQGQYQIAIRLQSNTGSGYFAYNWFYNNTTGGTGGGTLPGYSGYPTFSITSVKRNKKVTISANNLPENTKFNVLMGPMGTRGINGYNVTTINTGVGGQQVHTFEIPAQLKGAYQISIRLQSVSVSGIYAYNWFFNNTAN